MMKMANIHFINDEYDLPHHGHGDDDDTNYDAECERTTTSMNVRKMLMRSTCQTMVREEAATAYTKYLLRKIKSDDNSWYYTSRL